MQKEFIIINGKKVFVRPETIKEANEICKCGHKKRKHFMQKYDCWVTGCKCESPEID